MKMAGWSWSENVRPKDDELALNLRLPSPAKATLDRLAGGMRF